jgi:hypothetical protein
MQQLQRSALGATWWLADLFHIVDMQVDQSAKRLRSSRASTRWCMPPINLRLSFGRPFAGMVVTKERLARFAPLEADLDLPVSGW